MPCDSVAVVRARLEAGAAYVSLQRRGLYTPAAASSAAAAGGRLAARPPYQPWR